MKELKAEELRQVMSKKDVAWLTLTNYSDTGTLKQHAFRNRIEGELGRFGQLDGNISLCNRFHASTHGSADSIEKFDHEILTESACKTCVRIFDKLPEQN